jgi:hypothetical protein
MFVSRPALSGESVELDEEIIGALPRDERVMS